MARHHGRGAPTSAPRDGCLLARPEQPVGSAPTGLFPLGLDRRRDGVVYVPRNYQPGRPAPLVLSLHGAGGNGRGALNPLLTLADEAGVIVLGPDSRLQTWDVIYGEYGPDITFLDRALQETFGRYAVDPGHLAVEGFSDGASYALSVGLINGDLFTHLIAFSPGFMVPLSQRGSPRLFISHGTHDPTLPIDRCSRRLVPQLDRAGYDVEYVEFDGGHTVPSEIARDAIAWCVAEA